MHIFIYLDINQHSGRVLIWGKKIYINKICISNKVCAGDNNEIDNIGKYNKFIGEQRKE